MMKPVFLIVFLATINFLITIPSLTIASTTSSPSSSVNSVPLKLPYSLLGTYQYPADGYCCYVSATFSGNASVTSAVDMVQYCPKAPVLSLNCTSISEWEETNYLSIQSVVTSACGSNLQIGTAQGVFGGVAIIGNKADVSDTPVKSPMCFSFIRIQAPNIHPTTKNPGIQIVAFTSDNYDAVTNTVGCPLFIDDISSRNLLFSTPLEEYAYCAYGLCQHRNSGSVCSTDGSSPLSAIGIGMSVGAIGLILVTWAVIIATPSMMKIQ